jgi:hypothetical protein
MGAALLAGCGPVGAKCAVPGPTIAEVQAQIFTPSCSRFQPCHRGDAAAGMLSLEAGRALATLVGRAAPERPSELLVAPGDPDRSYLMDKVLDRNLPRAPPSSPERWTSMPPDLPRLDRSSIEMLACWIAATAED